jgi:hypothetical protein
VPGRRPPSAFAATMCSLRSSPRSSIGQTGSRSNGISSGARATLQAFDVMVLPGGYPNLLAGATRTVWRKAMVPTLNGVKAKRHYDPDNVFSSAIPLPVSRDRP